MLERQVRELAEELGRKLGDEALDPESKAALTELYQRVERALAGEQAASADSVCWRAPSRARPSVAAVPSGRRSPSPVSCRAEDRAARRSEGERRGEAS